MVVSRSDATKRRRKEGNVLDSSLRESPKRSKVHAQRKFAQGSSNPSSLTLTPIKDKEKVKNNEVVTPSPELIPSKRPKTEDFLTFLCFRGTSLLPASLDLFSVASAQESQDDDVPQHGESSGSRDCARNSRSTPTIAPATAANRVSSRSTDRPAGDAPAGQGAATAGRSERPDAECKRRPSTAVQALRKKYQEQRLAKQKADTLRKLAQKVKGKNMMHTRSSTLKEQAVKIAKPAAAAPAPCEPIRRTTKPAEHKKKAADAGLAKPTQDKRMSTRGRASYQGSPHDTAEGRRREGLRSGNAALSEEPVVVQRGQRVAKVVTHSSVDKTTTLADKEKKDKSGGRFASTLSDFSSDDDQPLVKKVKPVESSQQQHARKVVKRIVQSAKKVKSRMMTRSRVQKQDDVTVTVRSPPPARPTRKTKEAAALYMELLGKKLATPDADLDDDSLSLDSFPELPNARQNERRENELKAKAMKLLESRSQRGDEMNVGVKEPAASSQKTNQSNQAAVGTGDRNKREETNVASKQRKSALDDKVQGVALFRSKRIFMTKEKLQTLNDKVEIKKEVADKRNVQCELIKKDKHVQIKTVIQSEHTKKEASSQGEFLKKRRTVRTEFVKNMKSLHSETGKSEKLQKECVLKAKQLNERERREKPHNEVDRKEKSLNEVDKRDKPLNEVDKRDKPLNEVDKRDKPLNEVDKRDKPLNEVDKRDKPLNEVDKRDKPLNEVDKRDKSLNEVDRKDMPLNEVDRKEKLRNAVERKEKLCNEIGKNEKSRNEMERKEKPHNETERKEKLCKEIEGKENSQNKTEKKQKLHNETEGKEKPTSDTDKKIEKKEKPHNETERKERPFKEIDRKEKPHNETGKKEKTCSEIEKKKLVKMEGIKKENYQTDSSKKGSIAKKEQHLSGTSSKNIITEVDVRNESAVCGKAKESIMKHADASVMPPRRSLRRGLQQSEPAAETPEAPQGVTRAHQSPAQCKSARSEREAAAETPEAPQGVTRAHQSPAQCKSARSEREAAAETPEAPQGVTRAHQSPAQCKSARSEREAARGFEDKFSDSDEEPLGKIALKNTVNSELINSGKCSSDFEGDCRCKKGVDKVSADEASTLVAENNSLGLLLGIKRIKSEELKKMRRDGKNVKPTCVKKINKSHEANDNSCSKVETKKGSQLSSQNHDNSQDVADKGIGKKVGSETLLGGDESKQLSTTVETEGKMVKDAKNDPAIMKVPVVSVSNIDVRKVMKSSAVQKSTTNSTSVGVSEECTLVINRSNISLSEELKSEGNEEVKVGNVDNCAQESLAHSNEEQLETSSCLLSKSEACVSSGAQADTKQDRAEIKPVALDKRHLPESSITTSTKKQKEVCVSNREPCTSIGKSEQHRMFGKRKNRRKQKSVPRGSRSDESVCKMEFPCRRNTLKKHMKRVSSKKYFQMNKLSNVQMLSPDKSQPDTSHFEVASDSTSNRIDLDKDVNKFDSAKVNIFTSSPLKISSPFPSPSKKLRCKDLKGKRKVNMSTEQIEKWLNESYIEDAQEEKECGLCSKTDCKCSASSIDEELAHLSQFAMEKLTLGSGSECDALEDGRKKSSSSIDGTSCYLPDVVDNPEVASTSKPDHLETPEVAVSKEADLELESLFNNSFCVIENIHESGKNISANSFSAIKNIHASGETIPVNSFGTIENINESDKNISVDSFIATENISEHDKNISVNSFSSIENITESGKNISGNSFNTVEIISESGENIPINSFNTIDNISEAGKNISVECLDVDGEGSDLDKAIIASQHECNLQSVPVPSASVSIEKPVNISEKSVDISLESSMTNTLPTANTETLSQQLVMQPLPLYTSSAQQSLVSSRVSLPSTILSYSEQMNAEPQNCIASSQQSVTPSSCQLVSTHNHSGLHSTSLMTPLYQQTLPSTLSQSVIGTTHQPVVFITSQSNNAPNITMEEPKPAVISHTLEQAVNLMPQTEQSATQQLVDHATQQSLHKAGDIIVQQANTLGQQNNSSLMVDATAVQVSMPSVQQTMISSIHRSAVSSFHPTVSLPFELTQCISSPAQQATRTITLPLQQQIGQLFQHSVNSSFQQAGGIIIQQANPSPLQQSISLQLQQQAVGLPCHQTVTLPLQQLAFVPIKSVSLQLQQQVANIPLQQTIASTLPQTVSASLHQAVPLHQAANMHLQQTNSILFHQQTQMQQPTFQQQLLHQEGIGPARPMSPPKTALSQPSEHVQQQTLLQASTPQLLQQMQTEPKQLISVQTSLTMLPHMCASLQQLAPQKVPSPQMATLLQQNTYQHPPTLSKLVQSLEPCLQQPTPQQVSRQKVDLAAASSKQVSPKHFVFKHSNISTSSELNFLPDPEILQTSENTQQAASQEQMSCVQPSQLLTGSETLVDQQLTSVQEQTFDAPVVSAMSATSAVLTASPPAAPALPETSGSSEQQQTSSEQVSLEASTQSIPATGVQSAALRKESSEIPRHVAPSQVPEERVEANVLRSVHQYGEANNSAPEPGAVFSNPVVLFKSRPCQQPEVSREIQTNQKELSVPESQLNANISQFTNFQDSVSQPIPTELVPGSTVKPGDLKSQLACIDSQDAEQSGLADSHQCSALASSAFDEPIETLPDETDCVGEEQPCDSHSENSLQVVVEQPFGAVNDAPVEEESTTPSASAHECSAFSEGSVKEVNKNGRNVPGKEPGSSSRNEKFGDKYAAQKTGLRVVRIRKDVDKDQLQEKRYFSRTTAHSQTSGNAGIPEKAKTTKYYSKLILQRGSGLKMLGDKSGRGLGRKDHLTIRKQRAPAQRSIFQKSRSFSLKVSEQKQPVTSTNAFSLEDESSVYAFKTELELPPINTPFRRHARDSRTSSTTTSRSEEDLTRAFDDELSSPLAASTADNVARQFSEKLTSTASQQTVPSDHSSSSFSKCVVRDLPVTRNSTSIAVQVNLDNEPSPEPTVPTVTASEPNPVEPLPQRSMECSTQTEVSEEEENDGHLFYIPLQQTAEGGKNSTPSQQLIQGVTVKLGTEGSAGSNQCVIMRAKLVTKAPSFSCSPGIQDSSNLGTRRTPLMSQHPRTSNILMVEQKLCSTAVPPLVSTSSTYPPVGTVQPTARARPVTTHSDATTATSDRPAGPEPRKSLARAVLDSGSQTAGQSGFPSKAVNRPQQRLRTDVQAHVGGRRRSVEQAAASSSVYRTASSYVKRGLQKPKAARSCEINYLCTPVSVAKFPAVGSRAQLVEAPIYHPTEKEFQDPIEYIDKIRPVAEKFGLCRIVPPSTFKPECKVTDDMRFTAYNQYVHRMLHRWGPSVMEMMAIKKYLATQSIALIHPPLIGGMEVDLPRLYQTVQNLGGLKDVIEKKKWQRVAEGMRIPKSTHERATKLDDIYCKYLLPYDTLSPAERNRLFTEVEREWHAMESAGSSQDSATTSDATEDEPDEMTEENQECIVKGRSMPLNAFYRIARNTMSMWFRQPEPSAAEVEQEFWKHVMTRQCHVCVHSGSIDSSGWGYGFPCSKNSPFAKHPWNLKVLTNNSGSILRSMGPVMGVTVPTLHVGMVFTTCCWYRDPHGLPWIEYLHTGARKIWYGIPDEYSFLFRAALSKLVPRYCRNKTIWLPSDTAMVPPSLLVKEGVSLCHTVQEPGQFILVFPRAFTSSICAGYLVSESVYFAQPSWLTTAEQVFKDIQESCEPSVFSLERLLFSIATDSRCHVDVLKQVLPMVVRIRQQELDNRKELYALGLKSSERLPLPEASIKRRKSRPAPDEDGDYECEICRANLFVSLVTNSHEEGVYCLPHASQLLTKKRHHLKFCKLMYTYDQSELNELVQKLKDRIVMKSQRKPLAKHYWSSGQKT